MSGIPSRLADTAKPLTKVGQADKLAEAVAICGDWIER